ncbi:hypothetical protein TNCV_253871 [Trichonephila clavipes]|nr:hypothetical protein TNCV_253871 [Trichonephila clavipes]
MTKSAAVIVGYNRYHTPTHRIKKAMDVSLGYSSLYFYYILPKLIWCDSGLYPVPVVAQAWTTRFRFTIDRENKQIKEAIQSDG